MFFAPQYDFEAEEEAAAAEAQVAAPAKEEAAVEERKKATRLVGCVEKIQVELEGSSKPGETETITLPDGRVVAFVVPETFTAGQVIEVEVARTTYDEKNPAPLPPAPPSAITRDALAAFFRNGVASMERPEIKASLADPTAAVRPGPALIEIQQLELDKLGIERRAGCQAASRVPHDYADDKELQELQQAFMACAQQAYVDALQVAASSFRASKLRSKLTRGTSLRRRRRRRGRCPRRGGGCRRSGPGLAPRGR